MNFFLDNETKLQSCSKQYATRSLANLLAYSLFDKDILIFNDLVAMIVRDLAKCFSKKRNLWP